MLRVPGKVPLSCFGLELDPYNKTCQKCPHYDSCKNHSASRLGKVTLRKVKAALVPDTLLKHEIDLTYEDDVFKEYAVCYTSVFDGPPDNPRRIDQFQEKIRSFAREVGCSSELYLAARMIAFKSARGGRFYANMAVSPASLRLVKDSLRSAAEQFGIADVSTIAALFGTSEKLGEYSKRVIDCEILAGSWIVGHKRKFSGSPMNGLYRMRELSLDPVWLAIEPTYVAWINNGNAIKTDDRLAFRKRVAQVQAWLRKNKALTARLCQIRSEKFPVAIRNVVTRFGFTVDEFMAPSPVIDVPRFWGCLGLAMQQVDCLRLLRVL